MPSSANLDHGTDRATDNRARFATSEFDHWAGNEGLNDEERFLIERYLSPRGVTLEAGTAGGRILHELRRRGFESLRGFDIVEAMIDTAPAGTRPERLTSIAPTPPA